MDLLLRLLAILGLQHILLRQVTSLRAILLRHQLLTAPLPLSEVLAIGSIQLVPESLEMRLLIHVGSKTLPMTMHWHVLARLLNLYLCQLLSWKSNNSYYYYCLSLFGLRVLMPRPGLATLGAFTAFL